MKARHYDTALGKAWIIIDPLVMAFTFYLVRIVFMSRSGDTGFFLAHIIMGVSFFYYVRAIVEGGSRCIVTYRNMVLNTAAPLGVFPAVVLTRALIDLGPTMLVYFGVHLLTGQPWGLSLLLLPLVVGLLTTFSLGLGLFFAPLTVFYRDIGTLLPYVIRIWLYVTPVMYAISEIPDVVRPFMMLNPLFPFFYCLEAIFKGEWPSIGYLLWSSAWAVGAIVIGGIMFMRRERDYAVRL
jgi:teichoic acid transport system permease protein